MDRCPPAWEVALAENREYPDEREVVYADSPAQAARMYAEALDRAEGPPEQGEPQRYVVTASWELSYSPVQVRGGWS